MLYNNKRNRKINEKKVLHKVRKHWVTVSVALLSLIGAAGVSENNVHASSLNANHQNNNAVNNNVEHKTSTLVKPSNNSQQINPNQRSLKFGSANAGHQAQSIHQFNRDQLTKQTSVLRDRILSQLKTSQSQNPKQNLNQSASASDSNGQSAQTNQNLSGYYGRSANNSSVISNSMSSSAPSASQASSKMAKINAPQVGDDAGADAQTNVSSAMNDISAKLGQVGTMTQNAKNYVAQAHAASVSAAAQMSRYADVDPVNINSSTSSSDYGSASSYGFSDNSDSAKYYNSKIALDITTMPSSGALDDSINAQYANSMANSLDDLIYDDATAQQYEGQIESLQSKVDDAYNQASMSISAMSSMATDAGNQANSITQVFSSVASCANSAANNFNETPTGGGTGNNPMSDSYPVVNVTTAYQLENAYCNVNVHRINIMNNISLWDTPLNSGYKNDVQTGGGENYFEVNGHTVGINGLQDNGQSATLDTGFTNFNEDVLNGSNSNIEEAVRNLHQYTCDFYGCFSANNQTSLHTALIFDNTTFVGAQLAYNAGSADTNVVFEHKNLVNAGAAYSPNGTYKKYSYYSDGLSPCPFSGEGGPSLVIPEDPEYIGSYNINMGSNQQIIQISGNNGQGGHNGVIFKPSADVTGSTTDGDGLQVYAGSGFINLDHNSKVHIIPRGDYYPEDGSNVSSGIDTSSGGGSLNLNIGAGATLNITPMIDNAPYVPGSHIYAPNALHAAGGEVTIGNGGTLSIGYPDIQGGKNQGGDSFAGRSLPDGGASGYGGAFEITNGVTVDIKPYGNFLGDTGAPTNAANDTGNSYGVLINFGKPTDTNPGKVDAEQNSNVRLKSTAGDQPILLFQAPIGTPINVTDPQEFSLNLNGNKSSSSQLASTGTSIEGHSVTAYDDTVNSSNTKFINNFGQFNDIVLPSGQKLIPKEVADQIQQTCQAIKNQLNSNAQGQNILSLLSSNGINFDTIANQIENNQKPSNATAQDLYEQAKLIPYGYSSLGNNDNQQNRFNHSIDLPYNIGKGIIDGLKAVDPSAVSGYNDNTFGLQVAREVHGNNDSANDQLMSYDGNQMHIHSNGFNLTKGFAFKSVPNSYLEGVKVRDPQGNLITSGGAKKGDIISGYAYPGSYIRIYDGNNEQNGSPSIPTESQIVAPTLNDNSYDSSDQYKNDYVAIANGPSGSWSYTLPVDLNADQLHNLVATAHTATVGNPNSARLVNDYDNGINATTGTVSDPAPDQDTPQPAETTDVAPDGSRYHAYLSKDKHVLLVTGDFSNYAGNGIDGNHNSNLKDVTTLDLGNARNFTGSHSASWLFSNMLNLQTINTMGDWNMYSASSVYGAFQWDTLMSPNYLKAIVSTWDNRNLANNQLGDGNNPEFNNLIPLTHTNPNISEPISFIYDGQIEGHANISGPKNSVCDPGTAIPDHYTVINGYSVPLDGNSHEVPVVPVGTEVNTGDDVSYSNVYYHNPINFPDGTYPNTSGNRKQNDPTSTDDDDASSVSFDNNNKTNTITLYHYPNDRNDDWTDDKNAGQYFEAGRLKGDLDVDDDNGVDNSIYAMPNPFIVGYLTAKGEMLNPSTAQHSIDDIIKYVQNIKNRVEGNFSSELDYLDSNMSQIQFGSAYDYLPKIHADQQSASTSASDMNDTMNSLGILLHVMSNSYDPYLNLASTYNSLMSPTTSASNDASLIQSQSSDVSQIDNDLSALLNKLHNDQIAIRMNDRNYNRDRDFADSYAKNQDSLNKQLYLVEASAVENDVSGVINSAENYKASAANDDTNASNDNQTASSNSNAMLPYYDTVRGSASNDEASDFNSVAQSYASSATSDSDDIVRDSTEISHRDRQMNVADGIFAQEEAEINEIANSLEDYVPLLNSLNDLHLSNAASLSADYSNDYSAASSALNYLTKLSNDATSESGSDIANSGTGNYDSSEATSYSNDVNNQSSALSDSAVIVGSNLNVQGGLISAAINHNNADAYTRDQFNDAQTIDTSMMTSDLNSVADSLASADFSGASSAWVQIHNLKDKIANGLGAVERITPEFDTDIQDYLRLTGAAPDASSNSSSVSTNQSSNSANNDLSNGYYRGNFTVTVQDEDAQGNHTSRDIETIPINAKIGTRLTINPQQYQPTGFHSDTSNHPVNVKVTRQGVQPQDITFYYRIDHDNDSDGSVTNVRSASASVTDVAQNVSASSSSADQSSSSNVIDGAPIWIDGTPSTDSSNVTNAVANDTATSSASASQSSSSSTAQEASNQVQSSSSMSSESITSTSMTSSGSLSSVSAESRLSGSVENSVADNSRSSEIISSASRSASSRISAARSSIADRQSASAGSATKPSIRHQFLKHYEDRAFDVQSSADNEGAKAADRYIAGIDTARQGKKAKSNDQFYRSGYHAFKKARIRSMHSNSRPTGNHWSLVSALLLVFSMILGGLVSKDRRYNRNNK